jgi:hypothetical protein
VGLEGLATRAALFIGVIALALLIKWWQCCASCGCGGFTCNHCAQLRMAGMSPVRLHHRRS